MEALSIRPRVFHLGGGTRVHSFERDRKTRQKLISRMPDRASKSRNQKSDHRPFFSNLRKNSQGAPVILMQKNPQAGASRRSSQGARPGSYKKDLKDSVLFQKESK